MLQALLVPALGLTYLVAGPTPLRRRIVQLLAGAGAMVVAAGWWPVAVSVVPASARPYIGGSHDSTIWNLMFGYNGFDRLTGDEAGSALAGIGGSLLWARRRDPVARTVLAATLAVTTVWSAMLLDRTPTWHPGLRTSVLVAGIGLALAVFATPWMDRGLARTVAAGVVVVGLAGPGAYTVATAATPHTGAIPSAGPASVNGGLNGSTPPAAAVAALEEGSEAYTWVAATSMSNNAGYQLATGDPVMAIGGFNGSDPAPTLAQFQAYVVAGRIHWFIPLYDLTATRGWPFRGVSEQAQRTAAASTRTMRS